MNNIWNKITGKSGTIKKSHIPFRLNFLFFVVFGLFVALIGQLAYLQIVNKDYFVSRMEKGQTNIVEGQAPRGSIYDATGKELVSNSAKQAVLFTKSVNMTAPEIRETVKKIVGLIQLTPDELTVRDKKDYWLSDEENLKKVQERLSDEEKKQKLPASEEYQLYVDKVSEEELNFDYQTMVEASVYKKINGAYALQSVMIKNEDVTKEEVALVGENAAAIPGLSTGFDWDRAYSADNSLSSILGTISTNKTGLPEELLDNYLAKGYARNDRVGLSYLEKQYEPVLKGTKSRSEVSLDKDGNIESQKEVYSGEKGKNFVLTIDLEFQDKLIDIVERNYREIISAGKATYSEGAYVVAMNPQTGEIVAMVGLEYDKETGELKEDTLGTITKAFVPGSSIKGATIMAGYENGLLQGNDVIVDEPIYFDGGISKSSVFNPYGHVPLTPVEALTVSSNVYMMKIVMRMMGVEYSNQMILPARTDVFETLRKTYEDFGLGTTTGIDLPGESTGYVAKNYFEDDGTLIPGIMGNLMDLSYGNFDTYTPLQMAQYVSTIANGGYRIAPRIVKGIYDNDTSGNLGNAIEIFEPVVLNEVAEKQYISTIQEGFYSVVNSSDYRRTGARLQGGKYVLSAKTGTAETPIPNPNNPKDLIELENSTMVAYNTEDKDLAIAVMLPHLKDDDTGYNAKITNEIFNAYYDYTH